MKKRMKNKLVSSGSIEFLVVFVVLFIFFITIIDIGLFFRQIYLVQTLSDEVMANLQAGHTCSADLSETAAAMTRAIHYYYGANPTFSANYAGGFYNFNGGDFTFSLSCRTPNVPDTLSFGYSYKGLFLYRNGKRIYSNYSANTSYY